MIRKSKAKDPQPGSASANKIAQLQKENSQLPQLVKSHENVIDITKKSLKEKEEVCEVLTAKNRELTSENAVMKKTIATLEKSLQDQKNMTSRVAYNKDQEIAEVQRRLQISYYNVNRMRRR